MEQKRFLTADEVFQIFGIDASALEALVNSGEVNALADLGSFKYRSEDLVALVKNGSITPRTSGEMFQIDSDGEIPFLKIESDQDAIRLDDDVSYIELDEEALKEHAIQDSDSDVRIVGVNKEGVSTTVPATENELVEGKGLTETLNLSDFGQQPDSDSDVRIASIDLDLGHDEQGTANNSLTDSEMQLAGKSEESGMFVIASPSDSDVKLVSSDNSDSDVKLVTSEPGNSDSQSSHEFESMHSSPEFTMDAPESDSDISLLGADSGIRLSDAESGIRLSDAESGIRLANDDSGISLVGADSGISLAGDDSGISLVGTEGDSGISLVGAEADSGISLVGADSGISLQGADSGIRMVSDDTSEGEVFDPKPAKSKNGSDATQTLDLSDDLLEDSGFDVSLAEVENTAELNFSKGTTPGYPNTVVDKSGKTPSQPPVLSLSETFQLDEPPEVEDLDISDDLEGAPASDFSDEFAAVEEDEVFEASDDVFSEADVSVAEDDEFSDSEVLSPAAKAKKVPREPQWGPMAVAPIAVAALTMLATALTLLGGVATMWTGGDAPGPLGSLISTLAGLCPI